MVVSERGAQASCAKKPGQAGDPGLCHAGWRRAALLAGCSTLSSMNPVNWWHRQEGGKIAEQRPPPPGADQPYPNICHRSGQAAAPGCGGAEEADRFAGRRPHQRAACGAVGAAGRSVLAQRLAEPVRRRHRAAAAVRTPGRAPRCHGGTGHARSRAPRCRRSPRRRPAARAAPPGCRAPSQRRCRAHRCDAPRQPPPPPAAAHPPPRRRLPRAAPAPRSPRCPAAAAAPRCCRAPPPAAVAPRRCRPRPAPIAATIVFLEGLPTCRSPATEEVKAFAAKRGNAHDRRHRIWRCRLQRSRRAVRRAEPRLVPRPVDRRCAEGGRCARQCDPRQR